MGRKSSSSSRKSGHAEVPGCFNGMWNAPESDETPVARKSLSERKFSEGFEAPRNSLDIGSAWQNQSAAPAAPAADEIPFGFEFALRPAPPRLTMPNPAAAATAAAENKCRSPSVIARLMGLDTLPSEEQPLGFSASNEKKPPLQAQVWNLMADRCDFNRHQHFSRQLSRNGTVPASVPLVPFSAPAYVRQNSVPDATNCRDDDELLFDVLPFREQHPQEKQLQKLKDEFQSRRAKLGELKEELMFKQLQTQRQIDRSNPLNSLPRSASKSSSDMREVIQFLQSNKEFLVKFLQEPDSVFAKHVYDFQAVAAKEASTVNKSSKSVSKASNEQKSPRAAGFSRKLCDEEDRRCATEVSKVESSSSDHASRIILLKPNMRKQGNGFPRTKSRDSSPVTEGDDTRKNQRSLRNLDPSPDPKEMAREIARHVRERVTKELEQLEISGEVDPEINSTWIAAGGESSEPSSRRYTMKESHVSGASLPSSPRLNKTRSNLSSKEGRKQLMEKLKMTSNLPSDTNVGVQIQVPPQKQSKVPEKSKKHQRGKLLKLFSKDPTENQKGSTDESPRHLVRSKSASSLTDERRNGAQVLDRTHSCRQTGTTACSKSSGSENASKGKLSSLKSSLLGKKKASPSRVSEKCSAPSKEIALERQPAAAESTQDDLARTSTSGKLAVEESGTFNKIPLDAQSPRFLSLEISDTQIEKSEQPSPVSVLERVFLEESPSPVSFEDASSDLQELQMRLERLKLEESGRSCNVEQSAPSEEITPSSAATRSDSDSSPCSESSTSLSDEDEDQSYIRKLLELSDFTNSVHSLANWHSPTCPINPCLFAKLEEQYSDPQLPSHWQTSVKNHGSRAQRKLKIGRSVNQVQRRPETLHRQMLFDVVNEVLTTKFQHLCNEQPWVKSGKQGIRLVPTGKYLLQEVCRDISFYHHEYDNCEYPLENLVERDLHIGDQWMNVQDELQMIATRLEQDIFIALKTSKTSFLVRSCKNFRNNLFATKRKKPKEKGLQYDCRLEIRYFGIAKALVR